MPVSRFSQPFTDLLLVCTLTGLFHPANTLGVFPSELVLEVRFRSPFGADSSLGVCSINHFSIMAWRLVSLRYLPPADEEVFNGRASRDLYPNSRQELSSPKFLNFRKGPLTLLVFFLSRAFPLIDPFVSVHSQIPS